MSDSTNNLYSSLPKLGKKVGKSIKVELSPELVGLLSENLYQSPLKAIEELVVNSYDAGARECRIFIPEPGDATSFVVVYDDGIGMDRDGLTDLWWIGRSKKRDEELQKRLTRKQIGKFGIGKLATYSISYQITYISKKDNHVLAVTVNYNKFDTRPGAAPTKVLLPVVEIKSKKKVKQLDVFRRACENTDVNIDTLFSEEKSSWTFVVLEELKSRARNISMGRLKWVLRTAMPLRPTFHLFLNGNRITSVKTDYETVVDFSVSDLPLPRIQSIEKTTKDEWKVVDSKLWSSSFPQGISGNVVVTVESLLGGKSEDLGRSYGFFVIVRGRLINEEDARFGLHELSHQTFNRFKAVIEADDLDDAITAPREGIGDSILKDKIMKVLNEVFNEARERYEKYIVELEEEAKKKKEYERNWVPERLVEYPVADALSVSVNDQSGSEADESWFYLDIDPTKDVSELIRTLYISAPRTQKYKYIYTKKGRAERLASFNPESFIFSVNEDHELIKAYMGDPIAKRLLEDIVIGEALFEVYLREAGIRPHIIGEVLEKRDFLLRGLARDQLSSLSAISEFLRNSANNEYDLEIALISAARALGFVAKHIGGSKEPDGIARFMDYPSETYKITLEAKSSQDTPSAKDIDFAALQTHMENYKADGCLLIAPSYPGGPEGTVAKCADSLKISCWTVKQLADVVEKAETRQISARQILDIVQKKFNPYDVKTAIDELIKEPMWEYQALYIAIIETLKTLQNDLPDSPRTIDMLAGRISLNPGFKGIEREHIRKAIMDLASASQGGLTVRDERIMLNVELDELERRVRGITGEAGPPRRDGVFRESAKSQGIGDYSNV